MTIRFSYLFSTLDQKTSSQYLQEFYGQIAQSLEHHYEIDGTCTIAFSALFEVSLNQFSRRRDDLSASLKPVSLDTTRQYHLECILKGLGGLNGTSLSEPEHRHSCGVNLECLAGYTDLLAIHPNLQDLSRQIFSDDGPLRILKTLGHDESTEKLAMGQQYCCSIEYLAVCLAKVKLHLYSYDHKLHPDLAHISELFKRLRSDRAKNNFLEHFRDAMPCLDLQSKKKLCFDFHMDHEKLLDRSQLLRIQVGISSLNGW